MKSPATTKKIQSLMGRAAALNRFLSRSTDKCRPFFKALKKGHKDNEDLYIYLVVSDLAVSSALIKEELGAQHLKTKAILSSTLDNCHDIISFEIDPPQPSQYNLMKWAIELSQYNLIYLPKIAIKAQALADFVVEFTPTTEEEKMVTKSKEKADDTSPTSSNLPNDMWQLHVDGASNHKGAGACVVIITSDRTLLEQAFTLGFSTYNSVSFA
ncbi:hypothetical protein L3X38_027904 [Prunus dulcis]|uniref:RNase H type-1 domain-containing protein n=1 Tax=Prunus dulcis TaxID=3755 RepID=A0AAD4YZX2_PRUDU|nr:hypothetical protein L3X38_027904 [Prunus dulcis]